jgi:hypothetical protein
LIFFWVIYGTFNPAAPYGGYTQSSPRNMLNGLPALMFDQQFGILPNAPVYGFCLAGLVALARSHVRLAFELSAVAMAYLLATSAFHMWWGGSSPPARFAAAVLPLLALPGAWLWKSTPHSSTRAVGLAALLVSLAITGTLVSADGGRLAYNVRDGYARAAEWLSPIVDLSRGLPSFFRQTSGGAVTRACIWIAALLVSVGVLRIFERRRVTRSMLALATPTCLAASTMLALTAVWKQDGVAAAMPEMSQLNILQDYDVRVRPHGIAFRPFTVESAENVLSKISIATPTRRGTPPGGTLLLVPGIVAGGRYELRLADSGPAFGTASLVIGRLARPIKSWDLSTDFRDGSVELELPVNVESLVISGDGEGSRRAISLHSSRIWERSARLTRAFAHRAERYGPGLVFFFDEGAFAEVPGFWVRGGAGTQIAAASAEGGSDLQLLVRNAPVANRVEIEVDGQNQVLDLQPREERILPVQIAGDRPAALIQIRSRDGFRPSLTEPGSTDTRFLGVWIEFRP